MSPPSRWESSERGSVAAQVVIATPTLLVLPLLIVQVALWAFAAHAAQAAAAQGLDAARVAGGTNAAGQQAVQSVLDELATGPLTNRHITVTRTSTTVTVTVTGTTESLLPWPHLTVAAKAAGPIEQFTNP